MNPLPGINPKYCAYIGLAVLIEQAIGHGTVSLTNIVPAAWAPYITSWCNLLAFVGTTIMTGQAAYSSPSAGPMIDAPPPKSIAPNTIAKILIAVFALSMFLPMGAQAQTRKTFVPTGDLARDVAATQTPAAPGAEKPCPFPLDPLKLCGALTGNAETDMQAIVKRIQAVGRDDMNYAILKAKAANTLSSGFRLQCLQAILAAKDAAEGVTIKDASGAVIPRPDPAIVTGIEDVAELIDALSPQGPLMTSCAGAAQLVKTNTLAMVNAIVTGAAGIAALPAGL